MPGARSQTNGVRGGEVMPAYWAGLKDHVEGLDRARSSATAGAPSGNSAMRAHSLLLLLLCLVLAAGAAQAADPVRLHVILPITGSASFLGREQQTAIGLIEKQVNATGGIAGRPLAFLYHDDESKPQTSVQLVTEILTEHPAVILGPSVNPACNAAAPLLEQGPVGYCFSPVIRPAPGGYVFASGVIAND